MKRKELVAKPVGVSQDLIDILQKELPSFFDRTTVASKLNGIFTRNTLAMLHSRGLGPPPSYARGKVFYVKETFLAWMVEFLGGINEESNGSSGPVHHNKGETGPSGGDGQ